MLQLDEHSTRTLFRSITRFPLLLLASSLFLIIALAAGLSQLVKDTSVKAFIPPDHPSLLADALAEESFGISDSLALALVFRDEGGAFEPQAMVLVRQLTEAVQGLPNVRRSRVLSLATESSIEGEDGIVEVEAYVPWGDISAEQAADSRDRWLAMSPHRDSLVSGDVRSATFLYRSETLRNTLK